VEITGDIAVPKDAPKKGKLWVYVAQDNCLAEDAHLLGRVAADSAKAFFAEVFSKWGAELTVCGALEPEKGGPAEYYGRAINPDPKGNGAFVPAQQGEVNYSKVHIELRKGPAHQFPAAPSTPAK